MSELKTQPAVELKLIILHDQARDIVLVAEDANVLSSTYSRNEALRIVFTSLVARNIKSLADAAEE